MQAVLALLSLAGFVCSIIVIVNAFQNEIWKGFLAIFIPFYILYYTFTDFDHEHRDLIQFGVVIGFVSGIVRIFIH